MTGVHSGYGVSPWSCTGHVWGAFGMHGVRWTGNGWDALGVNSGCTAMEGVPVGLLVHTSLGSGSIHSTWSLDRHAMRSCGKGFKRGEEDGQEGVYKSLRGHLL